MSLKKFVPIVVMVCIAAIGCDARLQRLPLSGSVSWNNIPLEAGTIIFTPKAGTSGPSTGASIKNGTYRIAAAQGAMPGGKYSVEISALRKTGKKLPNLIRKDGPALEQYEDFIPANFNRQTTLEVVVDAAAAENKFDFALLPAR